MVVRNPYSRMESEIRDWHAGPRNYHEFDIKEFNIFLRNRILNREKTLGWVQGGYGHYIPQYLHLEENPEIKIHILKYENLKEEFNSLMKEYNLDLSLDIVTNKGIQKG